MPRCTQDTRRSSVDFVYGGVTLCAAASQLLLLASVVLDGSPTTPPQKPGVVWALPRSLAATGRISFDFFSFRYLDVSVPRVRFAILCIQITMTTLMQPGSPIRTSLAITLVSSLPELFAGFHVLLRLLLPRHPPFALLFLTI